MHIILDYSKWKKFPLIIINFALYNDPTVQEMYTKYFKQKHINTDKILYKKKITKQFKILKKNIYIISSDIREKCEFLCFIILYKIII